MTEDIFSWLKSFNSGLKWLNSIQSVVTKDIYSKNFFQYCKAVVKNPELISLKVEGLKNINTEKEFQAEDLLKHFSLW